MSIVGSIRSQLTPIHPEGYPFIGAFAAASLVLFLVWQPLGWLGVFLTAWCAYFFRDPRRTIPFGQYGAGGPQPVREFQPNMALLSRTHWPNMSRCLPLPQP